MKKTCKYCINYNICSLWSTTDLDTDEAYKYCFGNFKDKSRYIELPCAVGDTVWVNYNNKVIKGKAEELDVLIEDDNISCVVGARIFDHISMVKGFDFGTNAFLTKEDAERVLKGGEQG